MSSLLVSDIIRMAEKQLEAAGIDSPKVDAELLYCYLKRVEKSKFFMEWSSPADDRTCEQFFDLVQRRRNREPLQYITGSQSFMGLDLKVEPGVLIPRLDTEVVALTAELKFKEIKGDTVLDMCCGSGALGIALAHRVGAKVTATDINPQATALTKLNATSCGVKINTLQGNLFEPIGKKKYHMIVSNPPYIKSQDMNQLMTEVRDFEPSEALDGGLTGLDFYIEIINNAASHLKKKGCLVLEIGWDQAGDVTELIRQEGRFQEAEVFKDLAGKKRVVVAKLK